jgi:flavodoxin
MPPSLHIIYASTSGHTEYVVDELTSYLGQRVPQLITERQKAELAKAEDLLRGDVVILGSGTWNFGGVEGQLNMYMYQLLFERAKDIDLTGKTVAFICLGDDRYYFTTRCTEHFMRFTKLSHAKMLLIPLIIVNEPYGQEERIQKWGEKLLLAMQNAKLLENPSPSSSAS